MTCYECAEKIANLEGRLQSVEKLIAATDKFTGMSSFAKHIQAVQEEIIRGKA